MFETWDGDVSKLDEDLKRVLEKHVTGAVPGLSSFALARLLEETIDAVIHADGNTSEFTTSMFVAFKHFRSQEKHGL